MWKDIKHRLIDHLTRHLLKAVTEDDILRITTEGYLLRKRKLTQEEFQTLREEAKALRDSELWNLMKRELEWTAYQAMTANAKTADDIVWGKALFYTNSLQQKFLDNLSS